LFEWTISELLRIFYAILVQAMGMIVGLFFLGGVAANVPLIISGVAMHAAISKVTGRKGNWLVYLLASLGIALVFAIIIFNMFMVGGSSTEAYQSLMIGGGLIGASPGIGFVLAAFVMRKKQTGSLPNDEASETEQVEREK
jgi:hypothetical protein